MVGGTTVSGTGSFTGTYNFNLAAPYQANAGGYDAVYARMGSAGTTVELTGLFGGTGNDGTLGLATDNQRNTVIVGQTTGDATPTLAASGTQTTNAAPGFNDGFVVKVCDLIIPNTPQLSTDNGSSWAASTACVNLNASSTGTGSVIHSGSTSSAATAISDSRGTFSVRFSNAVQGVTYKVYLASTAYTIPTGTDPGTAADHQVLSTLTADGDGTMVFAVTPATLAAAATSVNGGTVVAATNMVLFVSASTATNCFENGASFTITVAPQPVANRIQETAPTAYGSATNDAAGSNRNFYVCYGSAASFSVTNNAGNSYSWAISRVPGSSRTLTSTASNPTTLSGVSALNSNTVSFTPNYNSTFAPANNTSGRDTLVLRVRETNANGCSNEYTAILFINPIESVAFGVSNETPASGSTGTNPTANNPNAVCQTNTNLAYRESSPTGDPYAGTGTIAVTQVSSSISTAINVLLASSVTIHNAPTAPSIPSFTGTGDGFTNVGTFTPTYSWSVTSVWTTPGGVTADGTLGAGNFTLSGAATSSLTVTGITAQPTSNPAYANFQLTETDANGVSVVGCTRNVAYQTAVYPQPTVAVTRSVTATCEGTTFTYSFAITPASVTSGTFSMTLGQAGSLSGCTFTNTTTNVSGLTGSGTSTISGNFTNNTFVVTVNVPSASVASAYDAQGTVTLSSFSLTNGASPVTCSTSSFSGSSAVTVTQLPDVVNVTTGVESNTSVPGGATLVPSTSAPTVTAQSTTACIFDNANGYGQTYTYSVAAVDPGNDDYYTWTPSGTFNLIGGGSGLNSKTITLQWTTTTGNRTIAVQQQNNQAPATGVGPFASSCNSNMNTLTVNVNPIPNAPTLSWSTSFVCENTNATLNVSNGPANGSVQVYALTTGSATNVTTYTPTSMPIATVALNGSGAGSVTVPSGNIVPTNPLNFASQNFTVTLAVLNTTTNCGRIGVVSPSITVYNSLPNVILTPNSPALGNNPTPVCPNKVNAPNEVKLPAVPGAASYTYRVTNTGAYPSSPGATFAWALTNAGGGTTYTNGTDYTISLGNSGTAGMTNDVATVTFGTNLASSNIEWHITATLTGDGCPSSGAAVAQTVVVNPIPAPDVVAGDANATLSFTPTPGLCAGQVATYQTTYTANRTYTWSIVSPPAGTTTSTAGTAGEQFIVTWGTFNSPALLTPRVVVVETDVITGCTQADTQTVYIRPLPDPTIAQAALTPGGPCVFNNENGHIVAYYVPISPSNYTIQSVVWNITAGSGAIYSYSTSASGTVPNAHDTVRIQWYGTGNATLTAQVTTTSGCVTSSSLNTFIYPVPAPVMSGAASVCQGTTTTYNVSPNVAGDTYTWDIAPASGGTFPSGNTGVSVPVSWNGPANTTYTLRCIQVSAQGCTARTSMDVVVNPNPTPSISGPTGVCANQTATYSTQNNAPASAYVWTLTPGGGAGTAATIASGQNTSSVVINTGSQTSYTLTVQETVVATSCSTTSSTYSVNVAAAPTATITRGGTGVVGAACVGVSYTYTANPTPSGVSYQWLLNSTPIAGATNQNYTTTWNAAGTNTLSVLVTLNSTQCSTLVNQNIVVSSAPTPSISGPSTACGGGAAPQISYTYTTPLNASNTYTWSFPLGGATALTPTSGTGVNSVTVNWSGTAVNRSVRVVEADPNTGCSTTATDYNVAVSTRPLPTLPTPSAACQNGAAQSYTFTTLVSGSTRTYTVTGGNYTVTSNNANDATISVNWTTAGTGNVQITETNGACSYSNSFNVTVNPAPTAYNVSTTTPNVCVNGGASTNTTQAVIILSGSQTGVNYTLVQNGGNVTTQAGNGAGLQWTLTPAPNAVGTFNYTVVATNTTTNCTATMNGTASVTVNAIPTPSISGTTSVCVGSTFNYTTATNPNRTWAWTVTGGTINSGQGSNTINVTWGNSAGTFAVNVLETNTATGCGANATPLSVTVGASPTVLTVSPTAAAVCFGGGTNVTVTLTGGNGQSGVTYDLLEGTSVLASVAGNGSSAVSFTVATGTGTTQLNVGTHTLTVRATGSAPCTTPVMMNGSDVVTVNARPNPTISGPLTVCSGTTQTYSVANNAGSSYAWTVSGTGVSITGTTNTASIQVAYSGAATAGTVSVTETNAAGCVQLSAPTSVSVVVNTTPTPTISGSTTPCQNVAQTYTTPTVAGATYSWSASAGGNITTGQGSTSVGVTWTGSGTQTLSVTVTSSANCVGSTTSTITVSPQPTVYNVTTSTPSLCATSTLPNAVINLSNSQSGVSYQLFRGSTALTTQSGNGSPLQFTDNTYGGVGTFNYTIVATSGASCTQNMNGTATVVVNALPNSSITGNTTVCSNTSQVYSVTAAGSQTYNWTVPAGWNVTNGQGTNAITVTPSVTGTVSVVVTNTSTNCNSTGTLGVTVTAAPSVFNVTPTVGAICLGQGTSIGLSGSAAGVTYTVLKGSQTITTAAGTGSALNITIPASAVSTVGNHVFTMTAVANAAPCNNTVVNMNGSLTVTVNPLPSPTISGPSTACIGQAVTFSTPSTGNNFAWTISSGSGTVNPPTNTNTVSITFTGAAGARTVQVVETNPNTLCSQTATYTLTANATPAPSVTPGPTQTVCASSTVTYSTTNNGGNTYSWVVNGAGGQITGGQGSSSITVQWGANAGTGTVTVTETAGTCSNSNTSTVTVTALPVAYNVGTTTPGVCVPGTAQITLSNSQAGFVYTLIRNGVNQTPTVTGTGGPIQFNNSITTAGTYGYTISATGAGCTNTMAGTATVVATNPPTPTVTGSTSVCANSSATYTVTPALAGSTYQYAVTGAGNALGAQSGNQVTVNWGANSGTVSVIETDVNNCTGNASLGVTVNPLPVAQTVTLSPTTVCAGGGLSGNSTTATVGLASSENGYTYQLLNSANNVVRTATGNGGAISFSPSFSNLSAGSITWTVRAISNATPSCTTAAMANSVTLTVVANPAPAVTGPTTPCQNGTVTYQTTNNNGSTYSWNIVSGTGSFTPSNTYSTTGSWTSTGTAQIRVVETNSNGCAQENILTVNVTTAPTPTITANPSTSPVCGQSTVTYSTTASGTGYNWTVGSGGTLNSGQGTNSIVVTWANATPDVPYNSAVNLTVTNGGCTGSTSANVTVNPKANPSITGDAARCSGQTGTYSTPFVVSGRNYSWTISNLPPGMSFAPVSGTNVTSINVNWVNTGSTPVVATVQVVETPGNSGNTCTGTSTFNVTVNPLPSVTITGPTQVCQNSVVSYTATPTQTGLAYAWNVTGANSFTGQGTETITVTWGTTNGTISLTATNSGTGCTNTASNNNVAVTVTPNPTPSIATPPGTTACAGSTVTYNVLNPSSSFTYAWANTGATSASTPSGNSYTVTWPTTPGNGSITLTATTTGGVTCQGSTTRAITIAPNPAPSISGQTAVCPNQDITYSTPFVANDIYQWTIPAGTFVVTGGSLTGNTVTVRWNSPGTTAATRVVTVTETSQNGCVGTASVTVTVNPAPTPIVAGNTNTCGYLATYDGVSINNTETYTVTNPVNNQSTFVWSLPNGGGTFISSSQGVNVTSVTVQWNEPTTSASITRVLRVQETTNATPNCTGQTDVNVQVNWNPKPAITGNRVVCTNWQYAANSTNAQMYTPYTYTTPGLNQNINPPASSYAWDVRDVNNVSILTANPSTATPGARITGSGNQVQVEFFNPTNAPVTMVVRVTETIPYTNSLQSPSVKACPMTDTFVVVVNPLPKPVIAPAPTDVCGRSTATYATTGDANSTFQWTVGTGVIVGAANANSVVVTWNDVTADNTGGFVQVSQTFNATGCSTTVRQNVNVDVTPKPVITGPTVLCQGTTNGTNQGTYTIATVLPNRSYLWSIDAPTSGPVTITNGPNNLSVFQITVNGNTNVPVNCIIRVRETATDGTNNGGIGGAQCFAETTYTVTLNPNPTPVITSSTGGLNVNGVCAGSTHTYATTFNNGNTYNWTVVGGTIVGASTNNTVSVQWGAAGAGSIAVRERVGTVGCYTDVISNITIRPLPTPDLTNQTGGVNPPSVCALSTTIYSTPNVINNTYAWVVTGGTIVNGQGTSIISVTWGAAGTGSVQVTETTPASLGSCSATRTLPITINPLPTPSIQGPPAPPVCINSTQTYSTALTAGRTYLWSNVVGGTIVGPNNTNTVNVNWTSAGNGSLTVTETITATNCSASATRTIPVNALPIVTITPSGTTSLCEGQSVTLAATDGFVSYTWNTGETTPRITVRQAGPYSVTVVDGNGCQNTSSTISVSVTSFKKPTVNVNGTTSFCQGESRTLTAVATGGTPLAYRWNTGATTSFINVTTSGVYNVEITYSNSCKILSDDIIVTVSPKPTATITASGTTTFCEGGNVILDGGAGFVSYEWKNGANVVGNGRTLQVRTSGSYTLKVKNAGLCEDESKPTVVKVNPNPAPSITVTKGNLSFCQGDSVTLDAGPGYKAYTWSPGGATTQSIVVKVGGNYSVAVKDTNDCSGQSAPKTVTVFPTPQKPGVGRTGNVMAVDTANKGYVSFQWSKDGNDINGANASVYDAFPTGIGNYRVTIKDVNGCSNISDPVNIDKLLDAPDQTFVSQQFALYPNPTTGNLTVKINLEQDSPAATLSVKNLIGSEVMTLNLSNLVFGDNVRSLDLSTLPSGIYYVEVVMANGQRMTARITKVD